MNWLHAPTTVLHLDLKLDNVLVDAEERLKVADFGFAAVKAEHVVAVRGDGLLVGNLLHKAPELVILFFYIGSCRVVLKIISLDHVA